MVLTSLRVERGSSPQPGPSGGRCPTAAFTIMCSHCGTARTGRRNGTPWCQPCRIWLFVCELTGQWVSAAECDDRKRRARNAAIVEQTRHIATASIAQGPGASARRLARAAHPTQHRDRRSPAGRVDRPRLPDPPHDGHGWSVRLNPGRGLPLYTNGAARAAFYDNISPALGATLNAVRIETAPIRHHPWQIG